MVCVSVSTYTKFSPFFSRSIPIVESLTYRKSAFLRSLANVGSRGIYLLYYEKTFLARLRILLKFFPMGIGLFQSVHSKQLGDILVFVNQVLLRFPQQR